MHARRRRPVLRGIAVVVTSLIVLDVLYLMSAGRLLTVRGHVNHADVIVVLGGDSMPRAARAAQLWLEGVAPIVLVSGGGDCLIIRDAMIARGVDGRAIALECHSRSTWQNAAFSAPILAAMNVRQAVLVTSWFHSRRAMACFSETSNAISWHSVPAKVRPISWMLFFNPEGTAVLQEGLKTLWYRWNNLCAPVQPPSAVSLTPPSRSSGS